MTTISSAPTLTAVLHERANATPHRVALRFVADSRTVGPDDATAVTYAQLHRRAATIAGALAAVAPPGARIVLLYEPGIEYVAAFFGCLYAGMVAVPAYPPSGMAGPERLVSIVADASASAYLTSSRALETCREWLAGLDEGAGVVGIATDSLPDLAGEPEPAPTHDDGRLAFLQYTSGSTGNPRGVMLTHANLLANTRALAERLGVGPDDRQVSWLPPYHDMGLIAGILQPIRSGIETVLMAPLTFLRDPLCWLEAIDRFGATYSGGPNFAFDLCVRNATPERVAALDLRAWRTAFSGAEPIRAATLSRFADRFAAAGFRSAAFAPGYGLAESSLVVTLRRPGSGAGVAVPVPPATNAEPNGSGVASGTVVPVGDPVEDCEVLVVDPATATPCAEDAIGEIWTRGPSVALGYWNRPEESAELFAAALADDDGRRFLRTGDLGFVHGGQLHIAGRIKDVIIVRGENHYPQDLEETAWRSDPRLRPDCTAAFAADEGDERVVIVQEVGRRLTADQAEEIGRAVRKRVAQAHGIPLHELALVRRGAVLKTSSGKVRRRATRQAYLDGTLAVVGRSADPGATTVDVSAGSPTTVEDKILLALRTALRLPALSVSDDFFEWGGDSLRAVEATAIAAEHGVGFDVHALYQRPSAAELAAWVGTQDNGAGRNAEPDPLHEILRGHIDRVPDAVDYPLSPIQRRWAADYLGDRTKTWGNMAFDVPIGPQVDADLLTRAVENVWQRHESLRTVFFERDGELRQRILPQAKVLIEVHDISRSAKPSPAREAAAIQRRLASTVLDLENGPLTRIALVHTPDGSSVFGVMHHMIADGWSVLAIRRELERTYRALADGAPTPSEPVDRYRDYAAWLSDLETNGALRTARSYWLDKLSGPLPDTLPVDEAAACGPDTLGASVSVTVRAPAAAAVSRLAATTRISTAVLLYTAFFVALHRRTGSPDLIVGTPLAGRDRADIRDSVGMFINQTPMRMRLAHPTSFRTAARELQRQLVQSVVHQRYQLDRMAEDLGIEHDPHRFPITNTFFSKMDMAAPLPAQRPGAEVPFALPMPTDVRFHLMFYAYEHTDGLRLECKYRRALFTEDEVVDLVNGYLALLDELAEHGLDVPASVPARL